MWEFVRILFGLKNALHTFQRVMTNLFGHLDFIKIYLDDLMIHSKSKTLHLQHIQKFFEIAQENNIGINYENLSFCKRSVSYLGHQISKNGFIMDSSRVQNLFQTIPKTKKDISKLLGLIQWFRKTLENASWKTHFLCNLLRKETKFNWGKDDEEKLKKIAAEIQSKTLLNFPSYTQNFQLFFDASMTGGGSILKQKDKFISFHSFLWNKSEHNYSIVEKETATIVKSIFHFRQILFSSHIELFTDSANATFNKSLNTRNQRWKLNI